MGKLRRSDIADGTPFVPEEGDEKNLSQQFFGQLGLPVFIFSLFPKLLPQLIQKLSKYPKLVKLLSLPFVLWFGSEFLSTKLFTLWSKLMSTAMCCVRIDSTDGALHSSFCKFLHGKKLMQSHREMSASSVQFLRNQLDNGHYHARNVSSGSNVVYDALNKFQFFWHDGRPYVLTVERKFKHIQLSDLAVWTFGWSPEPIRKMIDAAYDANARKKDGQVMTSVLVPGSGARHWQQRSSKPRRPLESVYLGEGQKEDLIKDMGEYLDGDTAEWYSSRGIPLRRGYLFHGSPGTGKTTLALAVAGHFKLTVYILSLLDPDIDDNALLNLFASVGSGSLVLLEDVDVAGLDNRPKKESQAKRKAKGKVSDKQCTGVTLSGLLNAIDGAGAPEGHILCMTTNKPDSLDEALTRAGRVDVRIKFSHATRTQIRDIFVNMYHPAGTNNKRQLVLHLSNVKQVEAASAGEDPEGTEARLKQKSQEQHNEVRRLAEVFADSVPQGCFSPAELQDYLILHKNKPEAAIDGAGKWVSEKLGEKALEDEQADDSESDADNIFTQDQSRDSTAASSTGGADEVAEKKKSVEKEQPAKTGNGNDKGEKESKKSNDGTFEGQLSGIESRLKEL